jgi:hypothetical protein
MATPASLDTDAARFQYLSRLTVVFQRAKTLDGFDMDGRLDIEDTIEEIGAIAIHSRRYSVGREAVCGALVEVARKDRLLSAVEAMLRVAESAENRRTAVLAVCAARDLFNENPAKAGDLVCYNTWFQELRDKPVCQGEFGQTAVRALDAMQRLIVDRKPPAPPVVYVPGPARPV